MNEEPFISIVTIARSEDDLKEWKKNIDQQTYENFEIVYSTREGIPEAWMEALSKASGEMILFTETDTEPVSKDWLETIAHNYDIDSNDVVYFGEFRGFDSFNFANTAMPRSLAESYNIDTDFQVGEDSEWFARMEQDGVNFKHHPIAPVFHEPKSIDKKINRSFDYGMLDALTIYKHGRLGPSTNTTNTTIDNGGSIFSWIGFFKDRTLQILKTTYASMIYWMGLIVGLIVYSPIFFKQRFFQD